jgi:hypothetical protein
MKTKRHGGGAEVADGPGPLGLDPGDTLRV